MRDKLERWAADPSKHAVQFLTIDEVDDLARWAYQELAPTSHFGMTATRRELEIANSTNWGLRQEIKMLKAALNNRDSEIKRLKDENERNKPR